MEDIGALSQGHLEIRAAQVLSDDPDVQVQATIEQMIRYAKEDAASVPILNDAALIRARALSSGQPLQCAVWQWVKERIQFTQDEKLSEETGVPYEWPVVEVLIRPRDMSQLCTDPSAECTRRGDCDDFSMYAASLLTALGIKCSFVTCGVRDSQDPQAFSHVYVAAYPDDGPRVAIDASHGLYCGWEAPNPTRFMEWPLETPAWKTAAITIFWLAAGIIAAAAAHSAWRTFSR